MTAPAIDIASLNARLADEAVPCTKCGQPRLRVEMRIEAKPLGSFSLAGAQMKFSATEWPWMVCDNCGASCRGKS